MTTRIRASDKFILRMLNRRRTDGMGERDKHERSTAPAVPERSSNTDPTRS